MQFGVMPSSSSPAERKLCQQHAETQNAERLAEQARQAWIEKCERENRRRRSLHRWWLAFSVGRQKATVSKTQPRPAHQIMIDVAIRHGVTLIDIKSASRSKRLIAARHEAMYLVARGTLLSLPGIGRLFGDRDHTTVINGIRRHAERNGLPPARAIGGGV